MGTMIGNVHFDSLVASAPVLYDKVRPDWAGVAHLLAQSGVHPATVSAVSWCSFGTHNIEANTAAPALAIICPGGLLATSGKRKTLGGGVKYNGVMFNQCKTITDVDYEHPRGYGRFCIELAGPGAVLLGRLQWGWHAKRFGDSRQDIMAAAIERDRILSVVRTVSAF